ncbi:hypothetical protein [Clostridium sp.]|nr:hypothetical protein [uncultured Clostridium sp.]
MVIDNLGVILPNLSIGIAILTFIIEISLCIIYYLKADIIKNNLLKAP